MSPPAARTPAPATERPAEAPAREEPEFNSERDIPTEEVSEAVDDESVAGEEDPGAALDTARPRKGPRKGRAGG
jgi:hypothetical protein